MKQRIIWDIDGVLGDFVGGLRRYLHSRQNIPLENMPTPTTYHFASEWGLTAEQWHQYYRDFVMQGQFMCMPHLEYPSAIWAAFYGVKELGYDNVICTARGTEWDDTGFKAEAKHYTKYWLKGLTDAYVSEVIHTRDKASVDGIVLLDDSPAHLEAFRLAGKHAVCYNQSYNQEWDGDRVNNLSEFLDIIRNLKK